MAVGADLGCAGDVILRPARVAGTGFLDLRDLGVQHRLAERRDDEADVVGEHGSEFASDKRPVGQAHNIARQSRDR